MLDVEHAMLAERFGALLEYQRRAERVYTDLASQLTEGSLRREVEQICREKQRHVALVQRLLEIVE